MRIKLITSVMCLFFATSMFSQISEHNTSPTPGLTLTSVTVSENEYDIDIFKELMLDLYNLTSQIRSDYQLFLTPEFEAKFEAYKLDSQEIDRYIGILIQKIQNQL